MRQIEGAQTMTRTMKRAGRRIAIDMLAGLALFAFLFTVTSRPEPSMAQSARPSDLIAFSGQAGERTADVIATHANAAGPLMVAIPRTSPAGEAALQSSERRSSLLMLAGVLSILAAANLAFFRHLHRVHASPRSGGGRRG